MKCSLALFRGYKRHSLSDACRLVFGYRLAYSGSYTMDTKLYEFLSFQDRDDHSPLSADLVVTRGLNSRNESQPSEPDWVHEKWSVRTCYGLRRPRPRCTREV